VRCILDDVLSGSGRAGHGKEGYYFACDCEVSAKEFHGAIGQALYEIGKIQSPRPTTLTQREVEIFFAVSQVSGFSVRKLQFISYRARSRLSWGAICEPDHSEPLL
jgi:hypothetical protein